MANVNDKAFDTMTADADKSKVDIGKLGKYDDYGRFARLMRRGMKMNWEEEVESTDEKGYSFSESFTGESTHRMFMNKIGDDYIVHPTLFPKNQNPSTDKKDWKQFGDVNKAYLEAEKRGELFNFGKDKAGAEAFWGGSWKKDNGTR